jgi:hypothetical protein
VTTRSFEMTHKPAKSMAVIPAKAGIQRKQSLRGK